MPIYKQTTEITKIDDVWANIDRDIVEVYFGDKNIFTVWGEYDGALPTTINANGDALLDYRIYGADGGVGDETENYFDGYFEQGTTGGGVPQAVDNRVRSNIVAAVAGAFCVDFKNGENFDVAFDFWNNKVLIEATSWINSKSYITPNNATSVRIKIRKSDNALITPAEVVDFGMYPGSTAPTSYIPYGYKLPMVTRSENLFNKNAKNPDNGFVNNSYLSVNGSVYSNQGYYISEFIEIENITRATFAVTPIRGVYTCFYNSNKQPTGFYDGIVVLNVPMTVNVPPTAKYMRISVQKSSDDKVCVVKGSTAPTEYIPYSKQTVPVYIGENTLDEGEYVSYSDGKIYRMVDGTLTPTDPPVSLPEIPTIDGTTVIDYDGDPKPSQMYVKYRKQYS